MACDKCNTFMFIKFDIVLKASRIKFLSLMVKMIFHIYFCAILLFVSGICAQKCADEATKFEYIQQYFCKEADNNLDEDESLKSLQNKLVQLQDQEHLAFEGHNIVALPNDTFTQNIKLKSLTLTRFNLDLILEPMYHGANDNPTTLDGFNNLVTLEVNDNSMIYGWKWSEMGKEMPKLKNLKITNSQQYYVIKELLGLAESFRYISIENSEVYWTESILVTKNLEWISLKRNKLENMSEDFIAKSAPKLRYLDLSFNNLETLPKHFTVNMEALEELNIKSNKFKIITSEILKPIWNNLKYFWIEENPLELNDNDETKKMCYLATKILEDNYITRVMFWYSAEVNVNGTMMKFSDITSDILHTYCPVDFNRVKNAVGNKNGKNQMGHRTG